MKTIFICGPGQSEEDFLGVKESSLFFKESPILSFNKQLAKPIDYLTLYRYFESEVEHISEGETCNLIGLSPGGVLALDYAMKNAEKVNSMVLIAPRYKMPKFLMKFQSALFHLFPKKVFEKKGISKSALLGLLASMTKLNFEKDLKKIVCPCPILYGERDEANKKAAKELSEKLSNAKLKMMKHPGHQVNVDHPLELSKMAEKFLKNPVFF